MTDYNFLLTKWYYGFKPLKKDEIFRTIILRIDNNHIEEFRKRFDIDERQKFSCDKGQSETTSFDISDCPSYKNDNDIYGTNPSIKVVFKNQDEVNSFSDKFDTAITQKQKTVWYPKKVNPIKYPKNSYWTTEDECVNQYPIYIVSYKRSDKLLTVKSLLYCGCRNFYIVIKNDKTEVENYIKSLKVLGVEDKLLIVPDDFSKDEEKIGDLNSIPQRNYAYIHSVENGDKYHWCLDDNIKDFYRREDGQRTKMKTGFMFYFVEEFMKRYRNVSLSSLQYSHLCPAGGHRNIIIKNGKVYSCILIKNDNNIMWRGSYNEDIILTLDTLIEGRATMTFQNFLCGKQSTGTTKGGNQAVYSGEGQQKKIDFLLKIHPNYVKEIVRYGHPHHEVSYDSFKDNDLGYVPTKLSFPKLYLENE